MIPILILAQAAASASAASALAQIAGSVTAVAGVTFLWLKARSRNGQVTDAVARARVKALEDRAKTDAQAAFRDRQERQATAEAVARIDERTSRLPCLLGQGCPIQGARH